jgi:hypothetical protein
LFKFSDELLIQCMTVFCWILDIVQIPGDQGCISIELFASAPHLGELLEYGFFKVIQPARWIDVGNMYVTC